MPFRSTSFGDKIAQPGTAWSDIDNALLDKGTAAATIYSADLFTDGDDEYKFGGVLFVGGESLDDGETVEHEINFDGFETLEDARAWVVGLDDVSFDINEVN